MILIEISNADSKLAIKSNTNLLKIPVVALYLKRCGFVPDDQHGLVTVEQNINELLQKIIQYLEKFEKIQLDEYCTELIHNVEREKQDFSNIVKQAEEIKKQTRKEYWKNYKISIPEMDSNVELKWYQKMPIIHAITLGNSANFSVPGSGKTWMAYSTFFKFKFEKKIDKLLVVAPLAAFKPWETEYEDMTGKKT